MTSEPTNATATETRAQVRLLFVDDEPTVGRSVARVLGRSQPSWQGVFVESGQQALERLAKEHFDTVVSDLQMPGMSGAELLAEVQQRHPDVVRVILSGDGNAQEILRAVPVAHQFLAKPFSPVQLRATLERAIALGALLKNAALRDLISKSNKLPSPPGTFARLRTAAADPAASAARIAAIVEEDPSLAAQVVRLATSAVFGLPPNVASVAGAVAYLGMQTIEALVLSTEIFTQFTPRARIRGFSLEEVQRHGVVTGHLARALMNGHPRDADLAFLGGMLHDMGRVVLAARAGKRLAEVEERVAGGEPRDDAEARIIGNTHAEVGAFLLALWGLPGEVIDMVASHHRLDATPTAPGDSMIPHSEPPTTSRRRESLETIQADDLRRDRLCVATYIANRLAHDAEDDAWGDAVDVDRLARAGLLEAIAPVRALARALK